MIITHEEVIRSVPEEFYKIYGYQSGNIYPALRSIVDSQEDEADISRVKAQMEAILHDNYWTTPCCASCNYIILDEKFIWLERYGQHSLYYCNECWNKCASCVSKYKGLPRDCSRCKNFAFLDLKG